MSEADPPGKPIEAGARRVDSTSAPEGTNPWRLSHILYLVLAAALLLWLVVTLQGVVIPLLILMGVALLAGTGMILARGRSSQQDALLLMLAIAAEHGMPLATTVGAFADQFSGRYRRRVLRLAALLDGGLSLAEALGRVPRLIPRDAVLMARVGEESGRLAEALRTAVTVRAVRAPLWAALFSRVAYILGDLLITQSIVGFILYFIVPKFEAIFADFGVGLPPITIFIIESSHFLIRYFFLVLLLGLVVSACLVLLLTERTRFAIPGLDRLVRRGRTALVLRGLAISIEGGRPIEGGLLALARRNPSGWARRNLVAAAREVVAGGDWRDALLRRGLIRRSDYDVLISASAVGNLPWAMHELARTAERRFGVGVQILMQTLFPLCVVAVGLLVLTIAVGFFSPLVVLIGRLSG